MTLVWPVTVLVKKAPDGCADGCAAIVELTKYSAGEGRLPVWNKKSSIEKIVNSLSLSLSSTLSYWKCYFSITPPVHSSVGWLVCQSKHDFFKGWIVTLPCFVYDSYLRVFFISKSLHSPLPPFFIGPVAVAKRPQLHPNYRVHSYHLILVVIRSKKDTRKGKTIKKDNLGARPCKYVEVMYVCTKDQ